MITVQPLRAVSTTADELLNTGVTSPESLLCVSNTYKEIETFSLVMLLFEQTGKV